MLAHFVGGQDLSADRLVHNSRRGVHRLTLQIAVALSDRAGVDADADLDCVLRVGGVVLAQCALDGSGGTDRIRRQVRDRDPDGDLALGGLRRVLLPPVSLGSPDGERASSVTSI